MVKMIEEFLLSHGSLAVFVVGILEDIIVVLPSSLVFLAAGFLLIPADASWQVVLFAVVFRIGIPATLGVTLGALAMYGLVYVGGKPIIERYGRYIYIEWDEVVAFEKRFVTGRRDELLLFFLRAIPIVPISLVTVACGIIRLPVREFFLTTFCGIFVRATVVAFLGWYLGKTYVRYFAQFESMQWWVFLVALVIGLGLLLWHAGRHRKHSN